MPDNKGKKNKHLTQEDRTEIQECLDHSMTFKAIGKRVGKDQTTISKEVKKHIHYRSKEAIPTGDDLCPLLLRAPFVCNPCRKRHYSCGFRKRYYDAKSAQAAYEMLLSDAREGVPLSREAFYETDRIVSAGIKRGQHLYHIIQTNKLSASKSTIYRHLKRGYLSVSAVDFPRVVKFKPRKAKPVATIPKKLKEGRAHVDFQVYINENGIGSWVELDTVIGRIGGKVIMTFDFTFCNLMFGILLENKTAAEVSIKIKSLKADLSVAGFKFGDIIPVMLTDNGGEFADVFSIEEDDEGVRETLLFFCDPFQSSQKPHVEKNHTLFRDIVPKGEAFDDFSQKTVNLIFSHVNSVKRKSLNGKSPFEVFEFTYGRKLLEILGIVSIEADNVIQSPKLLKG